MLIYLLINTPLLKQPVKFNGKLGHKLTSFYCIWIWILVINNFFKCCLQGRVTSELSQVLDEEEKRWLETLHIEEYQISLANAVIQVRTKNTIRIIKKIWFSTCVFIIDTIHIL